MGDLILHANEYGIVGNLDPNIMICVSFHSYVPIRAPYKIVAKGQCPEACVKPEIVERIRRYLSNT